LKGEHEGASTRHIAIDNLGRVIVGFSLKGEPKLLSQGVAGNLFRVLTINQVKPIVERTFNFPTRSLKRVGVNLSSDDNLLVTANDKVQLIDENGGVKSEFDIPASGNNILNILWERESPTRKTMLIQPDMGTYYFLNSSSLSLIVQCKPIDARDHPEAFSDLQQMRVIDISYAPPSHALLSGPLCGAWSQSWNLGDRLFTPIMLDNSTILEVGNRTDSNTTIWVQKINGQIIWSDTLPDHYYHEWVPETMSIARDGSRFTVVVLEKRGGSTLFDISPKLASASIYIYDAKTGKVVGKISIKDRGIFNREYSLSPKGDKLAILCDGIIEVWKL
jgi:hypothetical protein